MIIKFLGSGSAFVTDKENYHSNILITKTEYIEGVKHTKNLLIDAGESISSSLEFYGLDVSDIHFIFLTHNHSDHNAGLNYIGQKTYFTPNLEKPTLFANVKIMEVLWENVLKGNMGSVNNIGKVSLQNYFFTHAIKPKEGFQILNTEFFLVKLPHVIDDYEEICSYGLTWQEKNVKFFFTGDTMFDFWRLFPFWEWADIIFQECEFSNYENSVHCQYHQLKTLSPIYKKKMWLYHYLLNGKTYEELNNEVKNDGFAGLIFKGQEFNF